MQVVMGKLNGIYLGTILAQVPPSCRRVRAAVAYAHGLDQFFDRCDELKVQLEYYGLMDDSGAVSLPILERFLNHDQTLWQCRLINGNFHPKVIWWEQHGAYVGSANLTHKAWTANVEVGVFFSADELAGTMVGEELESLFARCHELSVPLTDEIFKDLKDHLAERRYLLGNLPDQISDSFQKKFGKTKPNLGLTAVATKSQKQSEAEVTFKSEWHETLQTLRNLSAKFNALKARPSWVKADAHPTVHFDQFLHAYYYGLILKGSEDDGRAVEKVNAAFAKNKDARDAAFQKAVDWWVGLPSAVEYEDIFIHETAPSIQKLLSQESVDNMDEATFVAAMTKVNAFRTHARQVKNAELGLPKTHYEPQDERAARLARWVWARRSEQEKSAKDILSFVLYGKAPQSIEDRLWLAIKSPEWYIPHFGRSILGETVGWALPGQYPPRNNRTNKALRALGFDIRLWSD